MLSPAELRTLDAALERIVPFDEEVRSFVLGRATLQTDLYRSGLVVLERRAFAERSAAERDAILSDLEGHPSIALMMQHAVEGFYTSAAGMADVGFRVTA